MLEIPLSDVDMVNITLHGKVWKCPRMASEERQVGADPVRRGHAKRMAALRDLSGKDGQHGVGHADEAKASHERT